MELVDELTVFMAYCCAVRGNKEGSIMGKRQAVNFYHEQWMSLSLPLGHIRVKAGRQGIKRIHVEDGNQPKSRRPFTWEMVKGLEGCAVYWGIGRRVVWMDLVLLYILQLRASELFAEDGGLHQVYCLWREDIAFFRGDHQVYVNRVELGVKVEVRF